MPNFTPGPHALDSIFPDEDGYKIVKEGRQPRLLAVVKNQGSAPIHESQGNARLYASAWDLYEALNDCAEVLEIALGKLGCPVEANDGGGLGHHDADSFGGINALRRSRAALKKVNL